MKQPEYIEGPEAHKNFERGMLALFKVPKSAVLEPLSPTHVPLVVWSKEAQQSTSPALTSSMR